MCQTLITYEETWQRTTTSSQQTPSVMSQSYPFLTWTPLEQVKYERMYKICYKMNEDILYRASNDPRIYFVIIPSHLLIFPSSFVLWSALQLSMIIIRSKHYL